MTFSNISSISKTKGIDLFIHAIEATKENHNIYDIVGKSSKVEQDFENHIRSYIEERKLKNIQLKGFISNMNEYLEGVDVVVLTSVVPDSLPTVLIEGLAKGKILIATDVGGVREIVDDSYGNIIIPANNIESIKDAINTVSEYSNEKVDEIKKKNILRAKDIFSIENQVKKMTEIYKNIIG
ncbi:glycosyltransferase [Aliarcobacter skirrowii]|uniref:glycosyltransferase n=1 Tax=Aliarcobacter skirrowii TaxID=28200 RepID=UPI0008352856|nr:glycosyltransferase [Aliarcobacter skirrowii]